MQLIHFIIFMVQILALLFCWIYFFPRQFSLFESKIDSHLPFFHFIFKTLRYQIRKMTAVQWLKYCRYGVKHYPNNQSINLFLWVWLQDVFIFLFCLLYFQNKCTQYWPEKDKVLDVGPCKIKFLEETMYAFHTKRKFTVQQTNVSKQLHFIFVSVNIFCFVFCINFNYLQFTSLLLFFNMCLDVILSDV